VKNGKQALLGVRVAAVEIHITNLNKKKSKGA
jgi:3-dehydroquinate dehydratase